MEPPLSFAEAEERYQALRRRYDAGELSPEELRRRVEALSLQDSLGYRWRLEAMTGAWQRWDGAAWVTLPPPHRHAPAPPPSPRCGCGEPLDTDARFCPACGALVPARPRAPHVETGPLPRIRTPAPLNLGELAARTEKVAAIAEPSGGEQPAPPRRRGVIALVLVLAILGAAAAVAALWAWRWLKVR